MPNEKYYDNLEKRLHENITLGQKVERTLETQGWLEIIEPMLDKMIQDVVGGKTDKGWSGGLLSKARKEEKREFYIGYKQFGIDFSNRVQNYIHQIKASEEKLKQIEEERKAPDITPMTQGDYAPKEEY